MLKLPMAIRRFNSLQVIIRIRCGIPWQSVTNLEVHNFLRGLIHQMVAVGVPCPEPHAHARVQHRFPGVGNQRRLTSENVDKLILNCMPVA